MNNKKKRAILIGICVAVLLLVIIVILKDSFSKPKTADDYKEITDVPGCAFDVSEERIDRSTAVTEISKNVKFLDYETYCFRNGKDLYILFNMNEFIVIAKKGTSFNLSSTDAETALSSKSLQGIWFTPTSKVRKEEGVYSVDVTAEVSITNKLYNDFIGRLVTLEKDNEEWSLFTGYVSYDSESNKANEKMVDIVSASFVASNDMQEKENFAMDIEKEEIKNQITDLEGIAEAEPAEEASESEEILPQEGLSAKSTTQEVINDENTAYSSSEYSMLPFESIGYFRLFNEDLSVYEDAYVRLTDVYDSEETDSLIADYWNNLQNKPYLCPDVPNGCHLEAVAFDVRYTSNFCSYVDVDVLGVDGETLRYHGIPYPSKTYDIPKELTQANDWYSGNIVFFVVPDGCKEYSIKISGINCEKENSAYFLVKSSCINPFTDL